MPNDFRDPVDELLARTLVQSRVVGAGAIDECLEEVKRSRAAGRDTTLRQVLVDRGHVTPERIDAVTRRRPSSMRVRPQAIGRYRILDLLGEGGMGSVYAASDPELHRTVALKLVSDSLSESLRARFRREARVLARIMHPNVVSLYDAGEADGQLYLVMERIEGRPLDEWVAVRKPSLADRAGLVEKVARGVHEAHRIGIVHRDLKPGNILVTEEGQPKVVDFGLAHWLEAEGQLTRSDVAIGTPGYMSPEQIDQMPGGITGRTDVHALGAILYELLTGRRPFDGRNFKETLFNVLGRDPEPPSRLAPEVPPDLDRIVLRALAKQPDQRHESASAFAEDLARWRLGRPIAGGRTRPRRRGRRPVLVAAGVAAILLVTVAVAWLARGRGGDERVADPGVTPAPAPAESDRLRREVRQILDDAGATLEQASAHRYAPGADREAFARGAERARTRVEDALALDPESPLAFELLGRSREALGDRAGAEEAFRTAIALDASSPAVRRRLGRLLVERAYLCDPRYPELGVRASRRAAAQSAEGGTLLEGALPDDGGLDEQVARAMLAHARADFAGMVQIALASIERFRDVQGVEDLQWLLSMVVAPPEEAIRLLDLALARRPVDALAHLTRGHLHHRMTHADAALADYERATELDPLLAMAWYGRGAIHHDRQEFDAAMAEYGRAIALDPVPFPARHNRGRLRLVRDDHAGAIADFDASLADEADPLDTIFLRGATKQLAGDYRGAVDDLERSLAAAPEGWEYRTLAETSLAESRAALRK